MLQHADPDLSPTPQEGEDALREDIQQIIAQRLERSHLKKAKPAKTEEDSRAEPSLRRRPVSDSIAAEPSAPSDRQSDFAAFDEDLVADVTDEAPLSYSAPEPAEQPPLSFSSVPDISEIEDFEQAQQFDAVPERFSTIERPETESDTPEPLERRQGDRRQAERRNMEFLRTELQWSSSPEPEEKKGLLKRLGFKPSRLMLLVLAIASAAIAGALALSSAPAPTPEPVVEAAPPPPPIEVPMTSVLVATQEIGAGDKLTSASLSWHEVPVSTLLPGYISSEAEPEALTSYAEAIARYPFFPGDPIRADKLLDSPRQSLAAVLTPGMRGISVPVSAVAAAGGFIKPDDHVDVVLNSNGTTRTVLADVRVLAIGSKFGPETTGDANEDPETANKGFAGTTTAILELDPTDAEVLVKATTSGALTLTLRPPDKQDAPRQAVRDGANQAIRLTSAFWNDHYSAAPQ